MFYFYSTAPASSPSNISAVVLSSTEIMVTWDIIPPIDQNGIITMYEVLYQPLETFNNSLPSSIFMTTTDTSHLISNIEEFVPYNISVRAYTSVGVGPFSEELTATTDEDSKCYMCTYCSIGMVMYAFGVSKFL